MDLNVFLKLLKKRQPTIWSFVIIFLIISIIFTFVQPLKYGSKAKLLVVQSTTGVDPYTVSKSNEYLGNLFSQVVYSSSFFGLVKDSQFNINKEYFGNNTSRQMKTWEKTVSAKSLGDTGIISINVYHPDPYQAQQISLAINDVLMNKNFNYQGLGDLVRVNIIDQPIVSDYPVKPNIILNLTLALFGGFVFSLFYLYFLPEEVYAFYFFRRRHKKSHKHLAANFVNNQTPVHKVSKPNSYQENLENINDLISKEPINNEEIEIRGNIRNVLKDY
ncbi:MAG: Wzz/FepE/Etk N-terminal domain-containing protein [Patescibacteria group bacterium]